MFAELSHSAHVVVKMKCYLELFFFEAWLVLLLEAVLLHTTRSEPPHIDRRDASAIAQLEWLLVIGVYRFQHASLLYGVQHGVCVVVHPLCWSAYRRWNTPLMLYVPAQRTSLTVSSHPESLLEIVKLEARVVLPVYEWLALLSWLVVLLRDSAR